MARSDGRQKELVFCSNSPQNRHPERSAPTDLSRDRALEGAESKDLGGANLSPAARSFSTTEAGTGRTRHGLSPWAENQNLHGFSRAPKGRPARALALSYAFKNMESR